MMFAGGLNTVQGHTPPRSTRLPPVPLQSHERTFQPPDCPRRLTSEARPYPL